MDLESGSEIEQLLLIAEICNFSQEEVDAILLRRFVPHPPSNSLSIRNHRRLDLNALDDDEFRMLFRFEKRDISRLQNCLGLPQRIVHNVRRCEISGLEGLCMYLRRLAYPNRLYELERLFGVSSSFVSTIANEVQRLILRNRRYLLENLAAHHWLTEERLQYYSMAVKSKGSPLSNCWGFIDGTARAMCRPSLSQGEYYSGHKRFHCVKYQSILSPDGIIVSLAGPYHGRRHDAGILRESNIFNQLEEVCTFDDRRRRYVIYGDAGYPLSDLLIRPYATTRPTDHQKQFNFRMSSVRQAVEWGFGKVIQQFAFLDFKKNQKLLLQEITGMYKAAVILTNCHTCLYGGQTSDYFGIEPISLETYHNVNVA